MKFNNFFGYIFGFMFCGNAFSASTALEQMAEEYPIERVMDLAPDFMGLMLVAAIFTRFFSFILHGGGIAYKAINKEEKNTSNLSVDKIKTIRSYLVMKNISSCSQCGAGLVSVDGCCSYCGSHLQK